MRAQLVHLPPSKFEPTNIRLRALTACTNHTPFWNISMTGRIPNLSIILRRSYPSPTTLASLEPCQSKSLRSRLLHSCNALGCSSNIKVYTWREHISATAIMHHSSWPSFSLKKQGSGESKLWKTNAQLPYYQYIKAAWGAHQNTPSCLCNKFLTCYIIFLHVYHCTL